MLSLQKSTILPLFKNLNLSRACRSFATHSLLCSKSHSQQALRNSSKLATSQPSLNHQRFSAFDSQLADQSFLGSPTAANLKDIQVFDQVKEFVLDHGLQKLEPFPNVNRWYSLEE